MAKFIEFHDIDTNSNVVINSDHIQEVRVKHCEHSHRDYYHIKYNNGSTIHVRQDCGHKIHDLVRDFNIP